MLYPEQSAFRENPQLRDAYPQIFRFDCDLDRFEGKCSHLARLNYL
ncbi:hypothetical protein KR51_00032770 [Rubidibacter lacunae KORDI 51-2]|uniref:Uncharacterized protein n=1 Tax=Rubidibacter lacunae KORDI 51-2 TaxID=582515 RepID=U5D6P1_9CHRO|nr:hypothetical protein KR51_00032770 [Rubidibacter lacunae KORDI 51-2]